MKRFITLTVILCLSVQMSGCSILRGVIGRARSVITNTTPKTAADTLRPDEPNAETTPVPSKLPALPTAKPTGARSTAEAAVNEYTSAMLGIMFTMPDSWMGKYRVQEGDGYLAVYFMPEDPIDETMGDGRLFTVIIKESEDDSGFFDNEQEIEINCVTYLCGSPTDVSYSPEQPEYDRYEAMMKDLPAVFASVRAADGK